MKYTLDDLKVIIKDFKEKGLKLRTIIQIVRELYKNN